MPDPQPVFTNQYSDVVVEIVTKDGRGHALQGLLDLGCSRSIILQQFATNCKPGKAIKFQMYGGQMMSTATSNIAMKLIEFSGNKAITYPCQVDTVTKTKSALYDVILGLDFIEAIGIDIKYNQHCMTWDEETIPLKPAGAVNNDAYREAIYFANTQLPLLQEVEA